MTDTKKDESPANDTGLHANGAGPDRPASDIGAGMSAEDAAAKFAAELAAKSAEFSAFKETALRQVAEAQNLSRRAEASAAEARKFGASSLARDVVAVADNLRRALDAAAAPADSEAARAQMFDALRQGVDMTARDFASVLERHGIRSIDPKGQKFDPNFHQAIFEVESDAAPGTVEQVIQVGYVLHERLLRPAMVGVAKARSAAPAPDYDTGETA